MSGVDANAAIFVALAVDEIRLVTFWNQVVIFNLIGSHAVILNADHISILPGQPFKKAFFNSLRQTVDADRYYAHTCSLIRFECMIPLLRFN